MKKKQVFILVLICCSVIFSACSGEGAECKVVFKVKDGAESLDIIVNPPGEDGAYTMDGGLKRNMYISANKPTEIEFKGVLTKTYEESGNAYDIDVLVKVVNDKLTAYNLKVTGGVYGDTPFECSK